MYYHVKGGEHGSADYAEALKWFRKLAEAGNKGVQCNFGLL